MSYDVAAVPNFRRELKKLARKFPSLRDDLAKLIESLKENPEKGTGLGKGFYKICMAITSKGRGKSGGARVITYVMVTKETVYLLSIFDKSDKETISDKELLELLDGLDL